MKIRAAFAGAGLMGLWHARAARRAGAEIVAVLDLDAAAAQRLAREFPGARVHINPSDLFAAEKIDVLHVCTPASSHFEIASAALERGIHVLVEKPMTPAAEATKRLYALAAAHRALLCPVHQFPFQRGVRQARAALDRIGQLRHFEATFCSAGGMGKDAEALDAIVSEILPHPLSLMHLFAPGSLREEGWTASHPAAGEFRATLDADGVGFSILISMQSRPTTTALRLFGTKGTIHLDLFHGFCVFEPGHVSRWRKIIHPFDLSLRTLVAATANLARRSWHAEPAYPGLRALIREFYQAISTAAAPSPSQEDTCRIAAIRDQLAATRLRSRFGMSQ